MAAPPHGKLYNPFRTWDADGFPIFPDVLGDGGDDDEGWEEEDHHHAQEVLDPFRVADGYMQQRQKQKEERTARPYQLDKSHDDKMDRWNNHYDDAPPHMADTSLDTSVDEEEQERVDLSFSSPERHSFFPKVGTTQDFSWSPDSAFSSTEDAGEQQQQRRRRRGSPDAAASRRRSDDADDDDDDHDFLEATGQRQHHGSPPRYKSTPSTTMEAASIIMEERLSILFDGISAEPSTRVIGRIHVGESSAADSSPESFYLTLRDRKQNVAQWDAQIGACQEDAEAASRLGSSLEFKELFFRVDTQNIHNSEAPILEYRCSPKLKPIPLLLKSKIQQDETSCKFGIRIRANPSNARPLTQLAIMIVVPPDLNGYSVQMSRKGGQWDDMKRTLSWTLDRLTPGHSIDIQVVFTNVPDNNGGNPMERRFPVLLQCQGDEIFSKVEIFGNTIEEASTPRPLTLDVTERATILFRKA